MRAAINCAICGKLFVSKNGNAKYCSSKCREVGAKIIYQQKNHSLQEQEAKKQRKKSLSITEIAVAARKAGMTYGQYVAKMGL